LFGRVVEDRIGGISIMDATTQSFTVWIHRSAKSMFGAASNPVMRNGNLLSFDDEGRAQAECNRLNSTSGAHVHYSVKPAHAVALEAGLVALADGFRRLTGEMAARR
jgi:hypothetical protein